MKPDYTFRIGVAAVICALGFFACDRDRNPDKGRRHSVPAAIARDKKPATMKCNNNQNDCVLCEYNYKGLCIMSLDWLSSLGDKSTEHSPVWIKPNDHIFWIGAAGETKLNVIQAQMVAVDCKTEKPLSPPPPISPLLYPPDYDDNQRRMAHAQANPGAKGYCFKNNINYTDPDFGDTETVDPHIYIGEN